MTPDGSTGAAAGRAVADGGQASLPVRALWFVFVGWWLAGIWLGFAWLLMVTVVGAPVGIKLLNAMPMVVSLKERTLLPPTATGEAPQRPQQEPLLTRALYFLLIGWWLSAIWAALAHAATLTIIGIPLGIWMYGKLPYVVSLYRY